MLVDQSFVDRFNDQIDVLKKQKASLDAAIGRASDKLRLLKANLGKNIEDVISPDQQSPAAKGGGGKDHR
jgi:hypothetical protein